VSPIDRRQALVLLGCAAWCLALPGCSPARDVLPVYLTWSDEDTSTTMTVQYHTLGAYEGSHVHYDTQPRHGELARYAAHASGFERRIEGVDRVVHVVPLTGLMPGTTYWFVAGDPRSGFHEERSFRTLPGDDSPVTFVAGGDMSTGWLPRLTSWLAARTDPDFALLGGDLAYCHGKPENYARWQQWFADWDATMRTPDGHLIPIVAAVGNHDRRSPRKTLAGADPAPFFNGFFYQDPGGHSYFARRFGPRIAVFVLDSGHLAPQGGPQREWLEAELRANADVPVRFALYHVALFPAHHPIDEATEIGRKEWLPLFDGFRLTAAFENHGHLQKRTLPLRSGAPATDGSGTVYFGDGCWGKTHPRPPKAERDYLTSASARRHFWQVTVSKQGVRYAAIGGWGQVFDHAEQSADGVWIRE
jgi:hypothetical protein